MKCFKHFSDEEESHFVGELTSQFGLRGYYFFMRTLSLMARYWDATNPGCAKFNNQWFSLQFHPFIKDKRTIEKMLDFTQYKMEIMYFYEDKSIVLYCPDLERRAANYSKTVRKDMLDNDKDLPLNAGLMHESCRNHAQKIAQKIYDDAKNNAENKEDK